jgi:imidazolonepropionase-like amidohydrolase
VFDGATATTHPGCVVLVRGEKIAAAGPVDEMTVPKGAKVIERPGATLLPRLIRVRLVMRGGTLDGMVQR